MAQKTTTLHMLTHSCVKSWILAWLVHCSTTSCVATPTSSLNELGADSGIHGPRALRICWTLVSRTSGTIQVILWTGEYSHTLGFDFALIYVVLLSAGLQSHTFKKSLTSMLSSTTPQSGVPTSTRFCHKGFLNKCSGCPNLLVHLISR